jgi:LPPG:FO 2-phospho-L-lactate transferase
VIAAIASASAVILAPSNPITSIGPILAVPGIREALRLTEAPIVAVSPIVGDKAVTGPAGILMVAQGLPVSIAGVAKAYEDFLDVLIVDHSDQVAAQQLARPGLRVRCTNTVMASAEDRTNLAKIVMSALTMKSGTYAATERP